MPKSRLFLDLCGTRVVVDASSSGWIERLASFLSAFVTNRPFADLDRVYRLIIEEELVEPPIEEMPLTWEGTMNDGNYGSIYEDERVAVLCVDEENVLVIDHANRTANAYFAPASYDRFFGNAIMMALDSALAANRWHLTHAACLLDAETGFAILVCAPSGYGKTTTSLALAHSGFSLFTDDASVLFCEESVPMVWGLPRAFKVHRKTVELLPWIGKRPDKWDENGEQGIRLAELSDRIDVCVPRPTELGAIILLGSKTEGDHRIRTLPKADALVGLAHENVAWRASGMVPKAKERFASLSRTVARVPTFELNAGPDLEKLPALVKAVVGRRALAG